MKKILFAAVLLTLSCKNEPKIVEEIKPIPVTETTVLKTECYQAVFGKDTITLSVDSKGTQVPSGKLTYNFFEKDKSDGTISGKMTGDTLFANYIYTAEGQTSQREVIFLKKGETFIEGYGDMGEDGKGNVVFTNRKELNFDAKTVFNKIACQKESLK